MRRTMWFPGLAVLMVLACNGAGAAGPKVGEKAPELTIVKWIGGEAVHPTAADGKTVYVVEFWATWCPPCRKSVPHLNKLQEQYKDKGLVIVGVTDDEPGKVEAFYKEMKMAYRVALDKNSETMKRYGIEGIPQAFLVGRDGTIVWAGHPMNGLDEKLEELLGKAK